MQKRCVAVAVFVYAVVAVSCGAVGLAVQPAPAVVSPDGIWEAVDATRLVELEGEPWVRPKAFHPFLLDAAVLEGALAGAPMESFDGVSQELPVITLPMPDGSYARFRYLESPIMEPKLAAQFPEIRTYLGQGADDPSASVRFDWTPAGFHAQILAPSGAVYIDPYNRGDTMLYASYYHRDGPPTSRLEGCIVMPGPEPLPAPQPGWDLQRTGETLRIYRLACAATGEYTAFHGGTVAAGLAAVVTANNRVSGIYETEMSIRMVLVGNNNLIIYTNPGTDPYSNGSGGTMLGQNQSNLDSVIGSANYDIGHVFSTGGGGVASLGVVCQNGSKARGVTGLPNPIGDNFYVDFVAHEMGHQYGANHTFNGSNGNCSGGNRNGPTAYEPGSGSTIMAYAGICGADNLQPHSDPFFHFISFQEIRSYVTAGTGSICPVTTSTGNADPTVDAGSNYSIPARTPFTLTASGSDPDTDPITYLWEQRDLGPQIPLSAPDNGSSPLFRSWPETFDPSRTFPRLAELLNNTTPIGERLPTVSWAAMDFRVTVRDNRAGGGGVGFDDMVVNVDAGSGPFLVTSPNGGEVWSGTALVTWDVAGTAGSPVNAANVDILLSTDGGLTYPFTLASGTPNDGSHTILVTAPPTTRARVKIQGSGNIFFDISNAIFTIDEPAALVITLPNGAPEIVEPQVPADIDVDILELAENLVPGSPTLHYRFDGGTYSTSGLVHQGGDLYLATLPATDCDTNPEFYFSAEGDGGTTITEPFDAPTTVYQAVVGFGGTNLDDDFETDMGWTVENVSLNDGAWDRGVPVGGGDRQDPPTCYGGSGSCYLTDNVDGNSDVDGGPTRLISPTLDLAGGATLDYAYWFKRDDADGSDGDDSLQVEVSVDGGSSWTTVANHDTKANTWRTNTVLIDDFVAPSATTVIRFSAKDNPNNSLLECGVDSVMVASFECDNGVESCTDGVLNQDEVRIDCGGVCPACTCTTDGACDNGDFCDGAETCDAFGECAAGTPVDCDDSVGCTVDSCNEATDSCDNVASDGLCDNGDFCDGAETCNSVLDCQAGTTVDCDDGVGCTVDSCNEGTDSCDNVASDGLCDNGDFCDGAETCDSVLDCQSGSDPCPGQSCDEVNDVCIAPATIVSGRTCMMHDVDRYCFDQDGGLPDPRLSPGQLELDLTGDVASVSVSMTCASGHIGSPTVSIGAGPNGPQSQVTVDFAPLPNIDCCTLTLSGDAVDQYNVAALAGDVNGSGAVNATDKNLVKGNIINAVDAVKFVFDVNASNAINATDKNLTKGWMGTSAILCP
ncbi:MAG: hypothetical protein GY778_25705 [bacterium]|nr:hypothetical protein [bacterium]